MIFDWVFFERGGCPNVDDLMDQVGFIQSTVYLGLGGY